MCCSTDGLASPSGNADVRRHGDEYPEKRITTEQTKQQNRAWVVVGFVPTQYRKLTAARARGNGASYSPQLCQKQKKRPNRKLGSLLNGKNVPGTLGQVRAGVAS